MTNQHNLQMSQSDVVSCVTLEMLVDSSVVDLGGVGLVN